MADYYVRVIDDGVSITDQFWRVEEAEAHLGIVPSRFGTHRAEPGEEMIVTLQKRFPGGQFHKLRLVPGEYFPRMARPSSTRPECSPGHNPDPSAAATAVSEMGANRDLYSTSRDGTKSTALFFGYHGVAGRASAKLSDLPSVWLEAGSLIGRSRPPYIFVDNGDQKTRLTKRFNGVLLLASLRSCAHRMRCDAV